MRTPPPLIIKNIHLASNVSPKTGEGTFMVRCRDGVVEDVRPESEEKEGKDEGDAKVIDARGGILVPSLCHSHIHLDKCNILSQCDELKTGTFTEALQITSKAKAHFTLEDLVKRGKALVLESVKYGVTAMRAHVEVDEVVGMKCVEAGVRIREEMKGVCDVGISVFAQDPLFTPSGTPSPNISLFEQAVTTYRPHISSIGSAPYVESSLSSSLKNISLILSLATTHSLHVDFHLDYHKDPSIDPLTHKVITLATERNWSQSMPSKRITLGHLSRIQLLPTPSLTELRRIMGELPVSFISLPQTDTYMLGPGAPLDVGRMRKVGFDVAMGVNNVGNAFTPQGGLDPMGLGVLGVAVWGDGTVEGCQTLLDAITNASKRAAGFSHANSLVVQQGDPADLVIMHGRDNVQELVLNPGLERTVIKGGRVVARRVVRDYVEGFEE